MEKIEQLKKWKAEYKRVRGVFPEDDVTYNLSGIPIQPLYTSDYNQAYPGQYPFTRGIYPTMYRGRGWSRRQLIGLDTPERFNERQREIIKAGSNAVSLIFCNSFYRGYDADMVDPLLVGTCGTPINTIEDMEIAFDQIPIHQLSISLNDPIGFTGLAMLLVIAKRRGIPFSKITGTSNQSDFISHFVANHMFYRLSLDGSMKVLLDHIEYINTHLPNWNPVSIVGQHMQQAGATPVQALAFTISSGITYIEETLKRGLQIDSFAPRFTFFYDISISLFEEIAKFRAGRRIWARLLKERFGAVDPKSMRFKFHGQTSGAELTRQQPLNNIVRITVQAMAGILGGAQSLHTDSYDEALGTPIEEAARIAINTQNILAEESGIADVIDPLGGSYYLEKLTDDMEEKAWEYIHKIDEMGGMLEAVRNGYIQKEIGESAMKYQRAVDQNDKVIVGVNKYQIDESEDKRPPVTRVDTTLVDKHLLRLENYKKNRDHQRVVEALARLGEAAKDKTLNVFEATIYAIEVGCTHGEVIKELRDKLGFGYPLSY
ncbi:acyl-CoA mutase large subunit family protein [Neobacillus massiliamazoniensis]|uniref:Methylmalonyl-CoA mutase large subunit n=1 Tax=Neobacillus massiliamazoniensis TaxID=1499688 RepID=A0A0U1P4L0_9BACI|nr:acyl-CoA mutase large subunit family protein [Neobacillus massiliamazoniensis]CRK85118.1 methylmalonyl-CoA mutase large subunit [Neobacillus massiliamazoniensis]